METIEKMVRVYDNGGESIDRYTVVFGRKQEVMKITEFARQAREWLALKRAASAAAAAEAAKHALVGMFIGDVEVTEQSVAPASRFVVIRRCACGHLTAISCVASMDPAWDRAVENAAWTPADNYEEGDGRKPPAKLSWQEKVSLARRPGACGAYPGVNSPCPPAWTRLQYLAEDEEDINNFLLPPSDDELAVAAAMAASGATGGMIVTARYGGLWRAVTAGGVGWRLAEQCAPGRMGKDEFFRPALTAAEGVLQALLQTCGIESPLPTGEWEGRLRVVSARAPVAGWEMGCGVVFRPETAAWILQRRNNER